VIRKHLAAVAPSGHALMLVTLRYPDELRDPTGHARDRAGIAGDGAAD